MHKNKSFARSLFVALSGLKFLLKHERNTRFHLAATIIVLVLSAIVKINVIEWLFILLAIFLVWFAEALNTSLEQLFDLVEPGKNGLVKAGKDLSAAAVLLTAIFSVIVGILVLGPSLFGVFSSLLSNYK